MKGMGLTPPEQGLETCEPEGSITSGLLARSNRLLGGSQCERLKLCRAVSKSFLYSLRRRMASMPAIASKDANAIAPYSLSVGMAAGAATGPTLTTMVSPEVRVNVRLPGVSPMDAKVRPLNVAELESGEAET